MSYPRSILNQKRRWCIVSILGTCLTFTITIWSIYTAHAQPTTPENLQNNAIPSPEDVGTRHVPNYRYVPISTGIQGLTTLFGNNNNQTGFFRNRTGGILAEELIDYYELMLPITMLNMPEDATQQYLLNMQREGNQIAGAILDESNASDDIYLSNVDREECDHPVGFISECLGKGLFTQTSTMGNFASSIQRSYSKEAENVLRDGGGMLPSTSRGVGTDVDGQTSPVLYSTAPVMPKLLTELALSAYLDLLKAQHGAPGDVGTDPGKSMSPITPPDTPDFQNPSHPGGADSNPQLPDDFGIGNIDPFDDWTNFNSSPWLSSTQDQMQQTIDDFGDIGATDDNGGALACLPLQRLANVANILGTERTQELMRNDVDNINCLPNKPAVSLNTEEGIHPLCTAQRALPIVTDTALILGLPNKYHGVGTWNVYLWPEEALRDYTGNAFADNTCVWVISAQNDAAFIGNQDNIGIIQRIREGE